MSTPSEWLVRSSSRYQWITPGDRGNWSVSWLSSCHYQWCPSPQPDHLEHVQPHGQVWQHLDQSIASCQQIPRAACSVGLARVVRRAALVVLASVLVGQKGQEKTLCLVSLAAGDSCLVSPTSWWLPCTQSLLWVGGWKVLLGLHAAWPRKVRSIYPGPHGGAICACMSLMSSFSVFFTAGHSPRTPHFRRQSSNLCLCRLS